MAVHTLRWSHIGRRRRRAQLGQTALIRAAGNGHAECVRLLLDAGADTNAKDEVRAHAGTGVLGFGGGVDADGGMWSSETCHLHLCSQFSVSTFLRFSLIMFTIQ